MLELLDYDKRKATRAFLKTFKERFLGIVVNENDILLYPHPMNCSRQQLNECIIALAGHLLNYEIMIENVETINFVLLEVPLILQIPLKKRDAENPYFKGELV